MKRLGVAIAIAALALPAVAQKEESVFVRAAKAANQATMKAKVTITNETLVTTGTFTTTDVTTPVPIVPRPDTKADDDFRKAKALAEAIARGNAMRLQRIKDSSADYILENGGFVLTNVSTNPQTLRTTQPYVVSTAQMPATTNAPLSQATTYQPDRVSTTPLGPMSTTQPPTAAASRPPDR